MEQLRALHPLYILLGLALIFMACYVLEANEVLRIHDTNIVDMGYPP